MPEAEQPAETKNTQWRPWPDTAEEHSGDEDARLSRFKLRAFRVVLMIAAGALGAMIIRNVILGGEPWADLANALFLLLVQWVAARRPRWLGALAWLVLLSLFINVADGLYPVEAQPITATHVMLPLLVLYGALMGSLWMSIVALVVVLFIYGATAWLHMPLTRGEEVKVINLSIAAVVSGLAALSVWIQHRRLEEALRRQTDDLRRELGTRLRLSAVVSHDIRNPLTALLGTAEIAKARGALTAEDLEAIESMARRISQIIDSARNIDAQAGPAAALSVTDVASIHAELSDMLGQRLAEKGQSLVLTSGAELAVYTNPKLLCNSVLSNLVVNASKFSPRDARLELSATTEGDGVRIQLCDRGPGFPDEILQDASASVANPSRPGTEGETGTGYGLHIAALFARVLGGQLEIRNRVQGGAAVAVVLPRKA